MGPVQAAPAEKRRAIARSYRGRLRAEVGPGDALRAAVRADPAASRRRPLLVDVRDARAYARGHVTGATNVPFGTFGRAGRSLPRHNELLVYGYDGESLQPYKVAAELAARGHAVRVVRGGQEALEQAGAPLEASRSWRRRRD